MKYSFSISIVTIILFALLIPSIGGESPIFFQSKDSDIIYKRTFHYTMTGRVRLLLFWLSRNNVGKGQITLEENVVPGSGDRREIISMHFGTIPERIPWRINRWGYGEEIGIWRSADSQSGEYLDRSQFNGFMQHSPEESIDQLSNGRNEKQRGSLYDGIISSVNAGEAQSEVYFFPLEEEVTIENIPKARKAFNNRIASAPPDKSRRIVNRPKQYTAPQGLLLCLRQMMGELSGVFKQSSGKPEWAKHNRPSLSYVYNAKHYYLKLVKARHHKAFRLPDAAAQLEAGNLLPNVAETELCIQNAKDGKCHSFTLWFPMEGALENVPVQIVDNPRWWLQVRLNLMKAEVTEPTKETK